VLRRNGLHFRLDWALPQLFPSISNADVVKYGNAEAHSDVDSNTETRTCPG
jgi:hypothetical protein